MPKRSLCLALWEFINPVERYSLDQVKEIAKCNVSYDLNRIEDELVNLSNTFESRETWPGSTWLEAIGKTKSKYGGVVLLLDDDSCYSSATIANFALEKNLCESHVSKKKLRGAFGRIAKIGHLFYEPDSRVDIDGQGSSNAAKGIRWKKAFVNM